MQTLEKWWQREPLEYQDLDEIIKKGGFRKIGEIFPENPEQSKLIKVSDKVAILLSNGMVGYYTITALKDISGFHIVGRDESGIDEKGRQSALGSGVLPICDVAYKVLDRFPWEPSS